MKHHDQNSPETLRAQFEKASLDMHRRARVALRAIDVLTADVDSTDASIATEAQKALNRIDALDSRER